MRCGETNSSKFWVIGVTGRVHLGEKTHYNVIQVSAGPQRESWKECTRNKFYLLHTFDMDFHEYRYSTYGKIYGAEFINMKSWYEGGIWVALMDVFWNDLRSSEIFTWRWTHLCAVREEPRAFKWLKVGLILVF